MFLNILFIRLMIQICEKNTCTIIGQYIPIYYYKNDFKT